MVLVFIVFELMAGLKIRTKLKIKSEKWI